MSPPGSDETLTLSLVNDLRDIARVAEKIAAFCAAHGLGSKVAFEVNLAVNELVSNAIDYGYDDVGDHLIDVVLRVQGDTLTVEIVDDGREFDPSHVPEPATGASLEDSPLGGLGIFLVHKTMDSVAYRRQDGRNVVTLTKHVAPARAE